jgi:choice-of-anchor C domain-containing protein
MRKWGNNTLNHLIAVVGLFVFANTTVNANLLTNGSFETGTPSPPINTFVGFPPYQIDEWTVTSGAVEWIGSGYWDASDGDHSIDMSGGSPASIATAFDTIIGETYTVRFDLAGNTDGGPTIKVVDVSVADIVNTFTFDITGQSRSNMGWTPTSFNFIANATTTELEFTGKSTGAYGAAIDNVSVNLVPIPPAIWLFGSGMLGLIGIARHGKNT